MKKNKNTKKKANVTKKNETINLDNEIIIGLSTPKKTNTKKNNTDKNKKKTKTNTKSKTNTKKIKKNKKKNKKLMIIKWTSILLILIIALVCFLFSSVFNTKTIIVINNSKLSAEEILNLSSLKIDTNMFKVSSKKIEESIKANPYVESVDVTKGLNGEVTLDIKERVATYLIKKDENYAYIDNQGYVLEISDKKLELPILIGIKTSIDEIEPGKRLVVEDLKKLDTVIKIVEVSQNMELSSAITSINIENSQDYILEFASEKKKVHFGDSSNINEKILWIIAVLESEKNVEGDIYVKNLNKVYFREKV